MHHAGGLKTRHAGLQLGRGPARLLLQRARQKHRALIRFMVVRRHGIAWRIPGQRDAAIG